MYVSFSFYCTALKITWQCLHSFNVCKLKLDAHTTLVSVLQCIVCVYWIGVYVCMNVCDSSHAYNVCSFVHVWTHHRTVCMFMLVCVYVCVHTYDAYVYNWNGNKGRETKRKTKGELACTDNLQVKNVRLTLIHTHHQIEVHKIKSLKKHTTRYTKYKITANQTNTRRLTWSNKRNYAVLDCY